MNDDKKTLDDLAVERGYSHRNFITSTQGANDPLDGCYRTIDLLKELESYAESGQEIPQGTSFDECYHAKLLRSCRDGVRIVISNESFCGNSNVDAIRKMIAHEPVPGINYIEANFPLLYANAMASTCKADDCLGLTSGDVDALFAGFGSFTLIPQP